MAEPLDVDLQCNVPAAGGVIGRNPVESGHLDEDFVMIVGGLFQEGGNVRTDRFPRDEKGGGTFAIGKPGVDHAYAGASGGAGDLAKRARVCLDRNRKPARAGDEVDRRACFMRAASDEEVGLERVGQGKESLIKPGRAEQPEAIPAFIVESGKTAAERGRETDAKRV